MVIVFPVNAVHQEDRAAVALHLENPREEVGIHVVHCRVGHLLRRALVAADASVHGVPPTVSAFG
jgi:hypothetical protein